MSRRSAIRRLPSGIWALGLVSLCMDASSELVHGLLPVFLATTLGASMATIGILEGLAEGTAAVLKVFSGALSDRLGLRKPLALLGYSLSALTKPIFPLAHSIGWIFTARIADRVGKGIRGAPRDALVADLTPPDLRGAAYGLRQGLDSVGAVVGPLLAVAGMAYFAGDIRAVLWVGVVPALLCVTLLALLVREPGRGSSESRSARFLWAEVRDLPAPFWGVVLLGSLFTLARFSEAFLVLRARELGLAAGQAPFVLVAMNVVYALSAYPAGRAADRFPRRNVLLCGIGALVAADVVLLLAVTAPGALWGAALWGLHMGLTQGLFAKLVADEAPASRRGTAFGVFHLASSVALFTASAGAGALWSTHGARSVFAGGALFASLAAGGLLAFRSRS